jgi:hypothetical protein
MNYTIWRACERLGIRPPGIENSWDDCNIWSQALILSYSQIRELEEIELLEATMKVVKR